MAQEALRIEDVTNCDGIARLEQSFDGDNGQKPPYERLRPANGAPVVHRIELRKWELQAIGGLPDLIAEAFLFQQDYGAGPDQQFDNQRLWIVDVIFWTDTEKECGSWRLYRVHFPGDQADPTYYDELKGLLDQALTSTQRGRAELE